MRSGVQVTLGFGVECGCECGCRPSVEGAVRGVTRNFLSGTRWQREVRPGSFGGRPCSLTSVLALLVSLRWISVRFVSCLIIMF